MNESDIETEGQEEARGSPGGDGAESSPSHQGEEALISGKEIEELRKKADERDAYRNELLRARADYDNLQKRVRKERLQWEDHAIRRFVKELLPVLDNLERALLHSGQAATPQGFEEGIRLTHQMLRKVFADHGVEEIRAEGETFNPEVHEAVTEVVVSDRPTGQVTDVLEKGYRHQDSVLRPSKVSVARNVDAAAAGKAKDQDPRPTRTDA